MAEWTSIGDILRDLSVAQGCNVPGSLTALNNTGPPPSVVVKEETEEEYYRSHGDGNFNTAPDLNLIQEMLSMVASTVEPDETELSSHLDSLPEHTQNKRKHKNVAMNSILEKQQSVTDFLTVSPSNMFKKKAVSTKKETIITPDETPIVCSPIDWKPSVEAHDYYIDLLPSRQLKQQKKEDIWTKAERQMKEIEERKKRAEVSGSKNGLELVSLLRQRHLLEYSEECVVCNVMKKHGYSFKEELLYSC